MTDQNQSADETPDPLNTPTLDQPLSDTPSDLSSDPTDQLGQDRSSAIKDDINQSDAPKIDPSDYINSTGSSSEFDELLKAFEADQIDDADDETKEEFGTLKESQIQSGITGLVAPELGDDVLAADEIAFGISAGELQAIVKTLTLLLRLQSEEKRRCRIVVDPDGVTWHANQANGFIEYFTSGSPANLENGDSKTVIIALSDLRAAAHGAREIATFRLRGESIRFTADRFERPIQTHSARSFPVHTDRLLAGIDMGNARPEVASLTLGIGLAFLGTIVPSEMENQRLSFIQIKGSVARAASTSIAAQVATSAFEDLSISFRPHFLKWLLPALKLRANFQVWHSEKFCVVKNEHLTFGFELIPEELPQLLSFRVTDTLRAPALSFITFLERAISMLGAAARLTIISDDSGKAGLILRADDADQSLRHIEMIFDAYRDGETKGPMTINADVLLLLKAMRVNSNDANVEMSIAKNALFLQSVRDDVTSSVIVSAKVK